jgi:hypothetical protein
MKLSKKELWEVWYGFNSLPRKMPRNLAWKVTQNKMALTSIIEELSKERVSFFKDTFSKPALDNPETVKDIAYAEEVKSLDLENRGDDFPYWTDAWSKFLEADFSMSLADKDLYNDFKDFLSAIESESEYKAFEKSLAEEKEDYSHLGLAILRLDEFPDEVDFVAMELLNPIIFETLAKEVPKKKQ